MAPIKIRDICSRLGLRAMIIRYGESWRTAETKALEGDIRQFNQTYEPYKRDRLPYPPEFQTDIGVILQHHGPRLWPDGPRDQDTCKWLFPALSVPEYPNDLYFSRDLDK